MDNELIIQQEMISVETDGLPFTFGGLVIAFAKEILAAIGAV